MAKPYSNDLRERVARSMDEGRSARETARLMTPWLSSCGWPMASLPSIGPSGSG